MLKLKVPGAFLGPTPSLRLSNILSFSKSYAVCSRCDWTVCPNGGTAEQPKTDLNIHLSSQAPLLLKCNYYNLCKKSWFILLANIKTVFDFFYLIVDLTAGTKFEGVG